MNKVGQRERESSVKGRHNHEPVFRPLSQEQCQRRSDRGGLEARGSFQRHKGNNESLNIDNNSDHGKKGQVQDIVRK